MCGAWRARCGGARRRGASVRSWVMGLPACCASSKQTEVNLKRAIMLCIYTNVVHCACMPLPFAGFPPHGPLLLLVFSVIVLSLNASSSTPLQPLSPRATMSHCFVLCLLALCGLAACRPLNATEGVTEGASQAREAGLAGWMPPEGAWASSQARGSNKQLPGCRRDLSAHRASTLPYLTWTSW